MSPNQISDLSENDLLDRELADVLSSRKQGEKAHSKRARARDIANGGVAALVVAPIVFFFFLPFTNQFGKMVGWDPIASDNPSFRVVGLAFAIIGVGALLASLGVLAFTPERMRTCPYCDRQTTLMLKVRSCVCPGCSHLLRMSPQLPQDATDPLVRTACDACGSEWATTPGAGTQICYGCGSRIDASSGSVVDQTHAPASARASGVASKVALDIPRIMEALKSMPLPESVRGWNQVISVEITDRPGLRYEWIVDGDGWHVTTGETLQSTFRLSAKEEDLINRLATGSGVDGYSFGGGIKDTLKCNDLVDGMAAYLRAFHQEALQEWVLQQLRRKHGVGAMSQEQLVSALGSRDLETRKAAADALGDQGWAPPPGKDAESYWAAKWDWSKARAAAAESAAASSAGASAQAAPSEVRLAVEYLVGHLKRKDVRKSPAVLQSLENALAELGPPAVAEMNSQLPRLGIKVESLGALRNAIARIFSGPGPVEPRIKLFAYGDEGPFRSWQAGLKNALVAAGPAVVEPLIAALHDENVKVRQGAAEVLERIGDPRAAASLAKLANDPDSAVR